MVSDKVDIFVYEKRQIIKTMLTWTKLQTAMEPKSNDDVLNQRENISQGISKCFTIQSMDVSNMRIVK